MLHKQKFIMKKDTSTQSKINSPCTRKAKLYHELTETVTLASPRNRSHNIFILHHFLVPLWLTIILTNQTPPSIHPVNPQELEVSIQPLPARLTRV